MADTAEHAALLLSVIEARLSVCTINTSAPPLKCIAGGRRVQWRGPGAAVRVFQRLLSERSTPERCVEAYYLQRTRFELIVERKLRRRQLTDDGNVEIVGRDFREQTPPQRGSRITDLSGRRPPLIGSRGMG